MVEETFISKLKLALDIEKIKGKVLFYGVFKMDEITDKWTLLLASTEVNNENREELFLLVRETLGEVLTLEEKQSMARIGLFESSDYLTGLLLNEFKTGDSFNTDKQVNGNLLHEGYVILANQELLGLKK